MEPFHIGPSVRQTVLTGSITIYLWGLEFYAVKTMEYLKSPRGILWGTITLTKATDTIHTPPCCLKNVFLNTLNIRYYIRVFYIISFQQGKKSEYYSFCFGTHEIGCIIIQVQINILGQNVFAKCVLVQIRYCDDTSYIPKISYYYQYLS